MFLEELLTDTTPSVVPSTTPTTTPSETSEAIVDTEELIAGLIDKAVNWIADVGVKILIALIIMIVCFKVINFFGKKLSNRLAKKNADATLSRVAVGALKVCLKGIVLITLVGYLGFQTASLSAVVASLGVGISLAVQGTLSNFAGGVIIIIMRPFKLGDFITSNGESGTVEDIKLFYTHIVTGDNRVVFIPNGSLANNVIVNASVKDTRRVDTVMSISYSSNVELAKNLIAKVCASHELIFKDPAPFITVGAYGDSSIDITIRVWTKKEDYWTIYFYLLDEIKKEFDANGIEIPYNTIDVNLKNN